MKKIIAVAVAAMMAIIVPSSCSHKPQAGTTAEISQQQLMELVDNQWLLADFDNHKADCIRHIAETR